MAISAPSSTRARALTEARTLVQRNGFNGFSFHHLGEALGIKAPSLYSHFRSKEDLGNALIAEYTAGLESWTETVAYLGPAERIAGLFELFFRFSGDEGRYCPLVALSADFNTLPKSMQSALARAFRAQSAWVKAAVEEGQKKKIFRRDIPAKALAELVIGLAYGAQNVARLTDDADRVRELKQSALKLLQS